MCDYFWQRMEKSQGDLTDIFQGSGLAGSATAADIPSAITDSWVQLSPDPVAALPSSTDCFFDDYADIKDPMLHELAGTAFFGSPEKKVASNNLSSTAIKVIRQPLPPPPLVGLADTAKVGGGVPITLPRTPAIKRRKSQARKVVCIPAPPVASNKPGGEVVPSDLWAWRKYGQKPIKGSPYPRGYYRCSSSKGCSARKQVERSRTDPNMLVITYTSDHNHPWPTQRNALAGSTRSQSSKNNNNASSSKSSSINQKLPIQNITREEAEEVEEEEEEEEEEAKEKPINSSYFPLVNEIKEMENSTVVEHLHDDFNQVFHKSFNELEADDFFADLAVLDADPMSLDEEKDYNKAMDPFNMFGWDGGNSFGITKRG